MALTLKQFVADFWSKNLPLADLERRLMEAGATPDEARTAKQQLAVLDTAPNDGRVGGAREIGSLFGRMNEQPRLFLEPGVSGKPVYDLLSLLASPDPTVNPNDRLSWVRELRRGERNGLHGMFIVGSNGNFTISHIPMHAEGHHHHGHGDQTPHNLQALWKVKLARTDLPATDRSFASGEFTFRPDRHFPLNDLLRGEIPTISGTIHDGNFEHGGPQIGRATLAVESLIQAQVLPSAEASQGPLAYFAFGTPEETYLCHRIEGQPDFYQLLRVELEPSEHWTPEALAKGDLTIHVPDRANDVEKRLAKNEGLEVVVEPRGTVRLKVLEEVAALVGPDFVNPAGR